jgi:hypothetical protein
MEKHIGYAFGVRSDHNFRELMWIFKELDLPRSFIFYMAEDNLGGVEFTIDLIDNCITVSVCFPKRNIPENIMEEVYNLSNYAGSGEYCLGTVIMFTLSNDMKEWAMEEFAKLQDGDWDWR